MRGADPSRQPRSSANTRRIHDVNVGTHLDHRAALADPLVLRTDVTTPPSYRARSIRVSDPTDPSVAVLERGGETPLDDELRIAPFPRPARRRRGRDRRYVAARRRFFPRSFGGNGRTCATCHRSTTPRHRSRFIATPACRPDPLFLRVESEPRLESRPDAQFWPDPRDVDGFLVAVARRSWDDKQLLELRRLRSRDDARRPPPIN